jgi:hypothetical protein
MSDLDPSHPLGDFVLRLEDFVPSLQQALEREPLDLKKILRAAVPAVKTETGAMRVPETMNRHEIVITDSKSTCSWKTDSLRALFRGDAQPPVLGDNPIAYNGSFALLDLHVVEVCTLAGDRRDEEMLEIYSALRRRPDGRSLGYVHDYMWQAAAIMLGTRPLSQAEFEAILSRLERSCRTFRMGPTSRNYVTSLRQIFGGEGSMGSMGN